MLKKKKNVANICICRELSGKIKKELKATPVVEIKVGEELLFHYKAFCNFWVLYQANILLMKVLKQTNILNKKFHVSGEIYKQISSTE